MAGEILNANTEGAVGTALTLTTEKTLSLYVSQRSGAQGNYRVGLEVTPDGSTWFELAAVLRGPGVLTCDCAAVAARPKVTDAQGEASEVDVHLVAR